MKKFWRVLIPLLFIGTGLWAQTGEGYTTVSNIPYRTPEEAAADPYVKARCMLDIYYPRNQRHFATVIWFHGGGLTGGEKYIPANLRKQGIAVVAVNYRLSPHVKSPVYLQDAAAAVAWTMKHIYQFGGDSNLVFVAGHSAGGWLTHMLALDKSWLGAFGVDADRLAGYFPFSGQTLTHFTIRAERQLPQRELIADSMAPINHVRDGLPPYIIITGDRSLEMTGRYEENAMLYAYLKEAGNRHLSIYELNGFDHGGMVDPACYLLVKELKKIVRARQMAR